MLTAWRYKIQGRLQFGKEWSFQDFKDIPVFEIDDLPTFEAYAYRHLTSRPYVKKTEDEYCLYWNAIFEKFQASKTLNMDPSFLAMFMHAVLHPIMRGLWCSDLYAHISTFIRKSKMMDAVLPQTKYTWLSGLSCGNLCIHTIHAIK